MPSQAITDFVSSVDAAELLWQLRAEATSAYQRARRIVRTATNPIAKQLAEQDAASALVRRDALIQAAHVRVVTGWEVFLYDLVGEYVSKNPASFRAEWGFSGTRKTPYDQLVATIHGRPFQNLDRARGVLKKYLGKDILGKSSMTGVDFEPVEQALILRHAIVHRGGVATAEMRSSLKSGNRSAHGYLRLRPPGTAGVPATHFERLKVGVLTAAHTLDSRAWMSPPRPK